MRASRLLSILTTLQARGRVTAQALAEQNEVSVRTIYRDVDALSAAGVPVYSDRGAAGGYRLLDGYRTRLNGLSQQEAEALFLPGLAGPAAAMGLGAAMAAAQLKLAAALPAGLRGTADRMAACFHLDAPGWFHADEAPEHLQPLADAVWRQNLVEITYRSWKARVQRRLAPLGLVLKGGAWYLVAMAEANAAPRTYRVARIRTLAVTEQGFTRPPSFDLTAHWRDSTQRLEREMHAGTATLRLSPTGLLLLEPLTTPTVRAGLHIGKADADGFRIVTVPVGSVQVACSDLLRFGGEAEVIGPPELRQAMAAAARALHALYAPDEGRD